MSRLPILILSAVVMGAFKTGTASAEDAPATVESKAVSTEATRFYVHQWKPLPTVSGERLNSIGELTVQPRKGEVTVVVFLASWCEPCQLLIEDLLRLEGQYTGLFTRFVFVFAHDTREDAEGFMREYKMNDGVLASEAIYKQFHNPPLPTIYVGDRQTWMSHRYVNAKPGDIARLEEVLKTQTAF